MYSQTRWRIVVSLSVLLVLSSYRLLHANEAFSWKSEAGKSVALLKGDQVVWQFNYAADLNKAYFHPVALPGGPTLSWDQPPDHVWHHALWFSWKFLNGVNYWEIDRNTGKPAGRTTWSNVRIETSPSFAARIKMDLAFVDPAGKEVMTGTRVVDISAPAKDGHYTLDWICSFKAGERRVNLDRTPLPTEPDGVAWGGYAGLSFRFTKQLTDREAITPAGPITFDEGRYRGKATAMDYQGTIDGKPVGVTICDHPSNLNHPTPWYVITAGMSYFSPAMICFKPHTLPAGESLTLRYRVIVHGEKWNAKSVEQAYVNYLKAVESEPE